MKAFFKRLWAFIKRLFNRGHEALQEAAVETKDAIEAKLREELAIINKEIEEASGEALEYLQAKAALIKSELIVIINRELKELSAQLHQTVENQENFDQNPS